MSGTTLTEMLNTDFCPWAQPVRLLAEEATRHSDCRRFIVTSLRNLCGSAGFGHCRHDCRDHRLGNDLAVDWPAWVVLRAAISAATRRRRPADSSRSRRAESLAVPGLGARYRRRFLSDSEGRRRNGRCPGGNSRLVEDPLSVELSAGMPRRLPDEAEQRLRRSFHLESGRHETTSTRNGKLTVWPRTVTLEPAVLADGTNRSLNCPSDKKTGNEGDRIGVRAWREGDSLRFVHWAQTAKCGRLIVSERQGPAQSSVVVAIDTDPAIEQGVGAKSSFESSIRIAASLCEQLTRQNVTVMMVAKRRIVGSLADRPQPSEFARPTRRPLPIQSHSSCRALVRMTSDSS